MITIRRGAAEDAGQLADFAARVFEQSFQDATHPDDMRAHLATSYGVTQQTVELVNPDVITLLASEDTELLGFVQVRRNAPPPCVPHGRAVELHRFYVDPRAHGTGLASQLMAAAHRAAAIFDARHLWLGVWERNARALSFYKKEKFVDVGSTVYKVGSDAQQDRVLLAEVRYAGT